MPWLSRDAIRMALQAPLRSPGRSVLTVLGLAIGVGAFVAMVSFGLGARSSVVTQFETLGTNRLRIRARYANDQVPKPLSDADVEALRREATTLDIVSPAISREVTLVAGAQEHRVQLVGVTPAYNELRGVGFAAGGMFQAGDLAQRAKICVLGPTTTQALFGEEEPLGQLIHIDDALSCRVVGIMETQGKSLRGNDMDDFILLPLTTHKAYLGMEAGYSMIEVGPKRRELVEAAKVEVTEILRRSHDLGVHAGDDFDIMSPDEIIRVAERVSGILTALLASVAGVSLLVGGIGIMNIQLVSVSERTQEIGIRAALGASPAQILRQFIAEALVLAAFGSLLGAALGMTASLVVAWRLGWPNATSAGVVIGSTLFGIAIGVLFGYIPAQRAARLDPIEALRRE